MISNPTLSGAAPRTRFSRLVALAALGLLCQTGPGFAHAHLKAAVPVVDGTVPTGPVEIELTFSEGVDLRFTGLKITGPGKMAVPTGAAALGGGGDTTLVVPVSPPPLRPGAYTVSWHALSTDGHKTSGTYTFSVKP